MSKTKSRRSAEPAARPRPAAAPGPTRSRWIGLGAIALVAVAGAAVWADWYYGLPEGAEAKYVGRQSCIQCHQPQHESWTGSHHDLAMDRRHLPREREQRADDRGGHRASQASEAPRRSHPSDSLVHTRVLPA